MPLPDRGSADAPLSSLKERGMSRASAWPCRLGVDGLGVSSACVRARVVDESGSRLAGGHRPEGGLALTPTKLDDG